MIEGTPQGRGVGFMKQGAGERVDLVEGHFFRAGIAHLAALDALRPSSRFSMGLNSQCALPSASM
jgi:hypothetical protein